MATRILSELNSEIYSENRTCETCLYWLADSNHPTFARIAGAAVRVGQCGCEESEAPTASTDSSDAFVFTPANGSCPAFELHPDATVEARADADHFHRLDQQLTHDAWM